MNTDPQSSLPLLKVPTSIYLERLDKFISPHSFNDVNLFSKLYSAPAPSEHVQLSVYSVPDNQRITFQQAKSGSYKSSQKGEAFGPRFKIQLIVPTSWRGETVVFVFRADNSEALIYDLQGHPIHGLSGGDWNDNNRRTDYIVTTQAKGGETFHFFIEMACNGLFGNGENNLIAPPEESRFYTLREADLRIFKQDAFTLYLDFQIIKDMARELIPKCHPRGQQALFMANKIVDTFYTTQNIQACIRIADAFLNEKDLSPIHTIASIGHCHIDTAWLWPYAETRRKVTRSWATQVYLMDRFPTYKFACSQAQQYAWLLEDHPDLFRRIQEKVKEKKFVPVGGTWVEFDGNIPSGESFVRQFMYGQLFFLKHFGQLCDVFWLPDTFGYSAQLPQIAKQSGIHYFFTQKLSWNNINKFPHTTFFWYSLDRTPILTHFAPGDTYCGQVTVKEMLMHLTNNKDTSVPISLDVFGNGDGGGGPTLAMVAKQARLANVKGLPNLTPMDPTEFFKIVESSSSEKLASWYGELYFELHRGTYTSQAETKKYNRQCEALLHDLELVYTILGKAVTYPYDDIEQLWKWLLLNQFHDVLPGSSIGLVYRDARNIYNSLVTKGTELLQRGLSAFPRNASSPSTWSAFNTCSFKRQWLLEIPLSSNLVFAQANAPNTHGYVIIEASPFSWSPVNVVRPHVPVSVTQYSDRILLENEFMQYILNVRGEIMVMFDKRNQFSVSCKHRPGNVFEMYSDIPLYWDAWDVEVYHLNARHPPYQPSEAKLSILSTGPLRAELCLEMRLSLTSSIRQYIRLDSLSPLLMFDTHVTWHEAHTLLKVAFPLDLVAESATYETAFGIVKRPTHMNTSWDVARFEVCGHRFADLSEAQYGVSLINDSKYGYSCIGSTLRMSLLRSPKSPDRECDMGDHHFRYALLPHLGPFGMETVHAAISFNQPLHIIPDAMTTLPFVQLSQADTVILDTIKLAEDKSGDYIFRFYECLGASSFMHVELPKMKIVAIWSVDFLERPKEKLNLLESKNGFGFEIRPFQIKTFRIKV